MVQEPLSERRAWELLTRDFRWRLPADLGIYPFSDVEPETPERYQVFEIIVAAVFAQLRPEYDWYVTPNRPDGGIDFVGRQTFLSNETLGITAAITVGGQCKKRSHVGDLVYEVAGSLTRMSASLNPTFFVVAFSARLTRKRVKEAREMLEREYRRHCHILDRDQIEGLLREYPTVVSRIVRQALSSEEADEVLEYLRPVDAVLRTISCSIEAPDQVLAGVPFRVSITIRSVSAAAAGVRFRWQGGKSDSSVSAVRLLGPVGANEPNGIDLASGTSSDDPMTARHVLELVTYAVGELDLGEVCVGRSAKANRVEEEVWPVGVVRAAPSITPRFFARPFAGGMQRLDEAADQAKALAVAAVGVVGSGGSGKSRLCEEFALEARRHGAHVISAHQTKTLNDPHRLLAEIFIGLVDRSGQLEPVERVLTAIASYDQQLADRSDAAIRSIFGLNDIEGEITEQNILSCLVLLLIANARRGLLILHLQDMHWCGSEVLLFFEHLVWQLQQMASERQGWAQDGRSGLLFLFEGRVHEHQRRQPEGWMTEPFETFLQRLDSPRISCAPFSSDDRLAFVQRLFENRHNADRVLRAELLELQAELIEAVERMAGGNPFHMLEQLQTFKERGVLGQNPNTGLLYMIQPAWRTIAVPPSIFEAIEYRWLYLRDRAPEMALLVWAAALLEDRLPSGLFDVLRKRLAPHASVEDVNSTEILWTGSGQGSDISFRHENYFRAIQQFAIDATDRSRVVDAYCDWFASLSQPSPGDQFRWALAVLQQENPDYGRAKSLLNAALAEARLTGDLRMARRIAGSAVDLAWSLDGRDPFPLDTFLEYCDQDLDLIRNLLDIDRYEASARLGSLREHITKRLPDHESITSQAVALLRRRLDADLLHVQLLFNNSSPSVAAERASHIVAETRSIVAVEQLEDDVAWRELEMAGLHSHAVALALAGQVERAKVVSTDALTIAHRSQTPFAYRVMCIHANILLASDPSESERILRHCFEIAGQLPMEAQHLIQVNLGMALVLRSHHDHENRQVAADRLDEASSHLLSAFTRSSRTGRQPMAAAAALMLGIVSEKRGADDAVSWFARSVAAATRAYKTETLWRAHHNLAMALEVSEGHISDSARDHALAALAILEDSLVPFAEPETTSRFSLMLSPLAQIARQLLLAGDPAGPRTLTKYPRLRESFSDLQEARLHPDRRASPNHILIRINDRDYVIY